MEKPYVTKGIALILLAASLSFDCSHKTKEPQYIQYTQEKQQNKQDSHLEKKADTLNNFINEKTDSGVYHIIKKGDTFDNLAEKYWGTNKEEIEIEKLNPGVNPDKLKIGQKIRVK